MDQCDKQTDSETVHATNKYVAIVRIAFSDGAQNFDVNNEQVFVVKYDIGIANTPYHNINRATFIFKITPRNIDRFL